MRREKAVCHTHTHGAHADFDDAHRQLVAKSFQSSNFIHSALILTSFQFNTSDLNTFFFSSQRITLLTVCDCSSFLLAITLTVCCANAVWTKSWGGGVILNLKGHLLYIFNAVMVKKMGLFLLPAWYPHISWQNGSFFSEAVLFLGGFTDNTHKPWCTAGPDDFRDHRQNHGIGP